jgi:hypothetical protein
MKKLITGLLILFVGATVHAQDIIVKNDGTEIKAKVKEITVDDIIKYKRYDHLEGPIRSIRIKKVFMIIYESGKREIFKKQGEKADSTAHEDKTKGKPPVESEKDSTDTTAIDSVAADKSEDQKDSIDDMEDANLENEQRVNNSSNNNSRDHFALAFGRGTTYGLYGAYMGYRAGAIEVHVGAGGFGVVTNTFSYSVGVRMYPDYNTLFFDLQYFNSDILNGFNINFSGLNFQAGGYLRIGDVIALSASGGLAMFFQLDGTVFTYNAGLKFRF